MIKFMILTDLISKCQVIELEQSNRHTGEKSFKLRNSNFKFVFLGCEKEWKKVFQNAENYSLLHNCQLSLKN